MQGDGEGSHLKRGSKKEREQKTCRKKRQDWQRKIRGRGLIHWRHEEARKKIRDDIVKWLEAESECEKKTGKTWSQEKSEEECEGRERRRSRECVKENGEDVEPWGGEKGEEKSEEECGGSEKKQRVCERRRRGRRVVRREEGWGEKCRVVWGEGEEKNEAR